MKPVLISAMMLLLVNVSFAEDLPLQAQPTQAAFKAPDIRQPADLQPASAPPIERQMSQLEPYRSTQTQIVRLCHALGNGILNCE